MTKKAHFDRRLFAFLRDLKKNNSREWFTANKPRYEEVALHPARTFISDFGPLLRKVSPHFIADPRPVGGSLFRIHRDVRFSKDKSPYKTFVGIQFRHKQAKSVHTPGFYLHLEPGAVFVGIGIWHPERESLAKVRDAIVADPAAWKRAKGAKSFREHYTLEGDALKRPPKGYDPAHPLIEDLKRKDFIASTRLSEAATTEADFLQRFAGLCKAGAPFVRYLCGAVGVPF